MKHKPEKEISDLNSDNNIRIIIENSDLKQIYQELKTKNFTLNMISREIGVDIKGPLYRNYSISKACYQKLVDLVGREIRHNIRGLNLKDVRGLNRIQVEHSVLKNVVDDLNRRGYSLNNISMKIGTQIGHALRIGYSINEASFNKLEHLYGKEIPHCIKDVKKKIDFPINLKKNGDLAEMIGIILGDGHLHKKGELKYKDSVLCISLNRIDEKEYVDYVKDLMYNIFKINPELKPRKGSKGIDLKLYGNGLIDTLVSKGLQTGDKIQNQVHVPLWINKEQNWIRNNCEVWNLKYRPLVIRCLKGLVDTDGSIYVVTRDKTININFRNGSLPLVKDFRELCISLEIKIGDISKTEKLSKKSGKKQNAYMVQIQAKEQVRKFIELIKPEKWKIKMKIIEEKLKKLGTTIEEALTIKHNL